MDNLLIIGVSGKQGSGKDYIVNNFLLPIIYSDINVTKMAFADQIKITIASQNNIDIISLLDGSKTYDLRDLLQTEGTKNGREKFGDDIWIKTLHNWIKMRKYRGEKMDILIITDCRFPNEIKWIEDNDGLIIRISAPNRTQERLTIESDNNENKYLTIKSHCSETALDNINFRYVINNDKDDVDSQLRNIIMMYINEHLNYAHMFNI